MHVQKRSGRMRVAEIAAGLRGLPGIAGVLLLGLAGCAVAPAPPPGGVGVKRSAKSLKLERYYAGVQARLLAQGLLRTDNGGKDAPFSARTLVNDFEKVALLDEYSLRQGKFIPSQAPSYLRRWNQPIRIGLVFGALVAPAARKQDRDEVAHYAKRLSRLSGVPMRLSDRNPNFTILFLYRDEQKTIGPILRKRVPRLGQVVINEIANSPRNTFCVAYAFSGKVGSSAYTSAIILVKAEHPALMRLSCIHEEMSQAMGLANDSPTVRPSIFNDDEEFALLTRHDALLLQMLYDKRLKPGMTLEQARPLLPAIARDVLRGKG